MKKALGGDMNLTRQQNWSKMPMQMLRARCLTTELYQPIRHMNIHPDSQFRSDFILITSVLTAIVTMIAFCALAFWMSSPDQHRDCAQRVTQSLSPNQARLLIRSTPTYNNARSWCASHDDSDILINHAKSWPVFPRQ